MSSYPGRTTQESIVSERIDRHGLKVARNLDRFIENKVLPGTGVDERRVLAGLRRASSTTWRRRTSRCSPSATACKPRLDAWHKAHPGPIDDMPAYRAFLERSATCVPPPADVAGHDGQRRRRDWRCRPARNWWCRS